MPGLTGKNQRTRSKEDTRLLYHPGPLREDALSWDEEELLCRLCHLTKAAGGDVNLLTPGEPRTIPSGTFGVKGENTNLEFDNLFFTTYAVNAVNHKIMNETPNKNVTLDDLATMVKGGFDEVNKKMDDGFNAVNGRLSSLEQGQEEIILKLDNVAYRFELVALQKRVEELEKRAGIKPATATA